MKFLRRLWEGFFKPPVLFSAFLLFVALGALASAFPDMTQALPGYVIVLQSPGASPGPINIGVTPIAAPTTLATSGPFLPTVSEMYVFNGNNLIPVANITSSDGSAPGGAALFTGNINFAFNGTTLDRIRKDTYAAGPLWVSDGGSATVPAPTNTSTVVCNGPCRLAGAMITTVGAGTFICYDNTNSASGTILLDATASAAVGTMIPDHFAAAVGVFCVSSATGPALTIGKFGP